MSFFPCFGFAFGLPTYTVCCVTRSILYHLSLFLTFVKLFVHLADIWLHLVRRHHLWSMFTTIICTTWNQLYHEHRQCGQCSLLRESFRLSRIWLPILLFKKRQTLKCKNKIQKFLERTEVPLRLCLQTSGDKGTRCEDTMVL